MFALHVSNFTRRLSQSLPLSLRWCHGFMYKASSFAYRLLRVFVKFLNNSAQIGNNRDQNNYLLKTCYTASCEVAGTQIEIAE